MHQTSLHFPKTRSFPTYFPRIGDTDLMGQNGRRRGAGSGASRAYPSRGPAVREARPRDFDLGGAALRRRLLAAGGGGEEGRRRRDPSSSKEQMALPRLASRLTCFPRSCFPWSI